jgi:1,5-anhydro-D-fructose reductase (1,5-anhydro-D-mannitol-forming)
MARNSSEAAVIQAAFARSRVPLFVAYYRRALPRYVRAKQLLHQVGKICSVTVRLRIAGNCCKSIPDAKGWRVTKSVSGGGLFQDVGSHVCDIVDWMFGPMIVTHSHTGSGRGADAVSSWSTHARDGNRFDGAEDHVIFTFALPLCKTAQKNIAIFDFDAARGQEADRVTVVGENGVLSFPALGLSDADPEIRLQDSQGALILREVVAQPDYVHGPLIASIVGELRGTEGVVCESTAENGLRTAVVVDAALEWGRDPATLRLRAFASAVEREDDERRIRDALTACCREISC